MNSPDTPPEETLNRLGGDWRIYQLRRGHRFATDDVLVAWLAVQARPRAMSMLDLGAGVGSIGLLALGVLPPSARLTAIEVQAVSVGLLRKTIAINAIEARVRVEHADLRDSKTLATDEQRFELITGNPPYLPRGSASRSPHPQKAAARLELHGDVFDYCGAAARSLAGDGRFCFCHAAGDPRPEQAIQQAGLFVLRRQEVVFRAGKAPTIALYLCAAQPGERVDPEPIVVRDADRAVSAEYLSIRCALALP